MKIEVYTRSMNAKLYQLSQSTLDLPYKRKRQLFTSADGYFYDNILKSNADIIINLDEDAFITNNAHLEKLLEYVIENDFVNCGVPDGGLLPIRQHNPIVTNPFFNILNVRRIKEKFDLKEINENYASHKVEFEKYTPHHLLKSSYQYDYYEPYNSFFVWLAVNFKTLYLDADVHQDGISTIVKNHLGQPFLNHSWYSRSYDKDEFHTNRINTIIDEAFGVNVAKDFVHNSNFILNMLENIGNKYYYPLKYRLERKIWDIKNRY